MAGSFTRELPKLYVHVPSSETESDVEDMKAYLLSEIRELCVRHNFRRPTVKI